LSWPKVAWWLKGHPTAYLGAHQDVDLGIVTGRVAGEIPAEAQYLAAEVAALDSAINVGAIIDSAANDNPEKTS
jgi:neutral amino acid transport system ATP-binding protein